MSHLPTGEEGEEYVNPFVIEVRSLSANEGDAEGATRRFGALLGRRALR